MKIRDYVISAASCENFEPVEGDDRLYRKEIIYPGKFLKKNPDGSIEFELTVTDATLDHWVNTFSAMKGNGIEVPLPIEHTNDPEKRRGTVEDIKKEYNPQRGTNALYMYARFRDAETAAALSKTSQVSLYAPQKFTDGKGKTYKMPIRHVAITDYPLIPGLSGWSAMKASIALSETGEEPITESTMTFKDLADQLGIEVEDGASDEDIAALIVQEWDADPEMVDDEEPIDDEEVPVDYEEEPVDDGVPADDTEMGDDEEVPADDEEPAPVSASITRTVVNARKAQLESLVQQGKCTPAQRDLLVKQYGSSKRVAFALSHNSLDDDGFESVVSALSLNRPIKLSEKTGAQHDVKSGEKNPLIADAERRASRRNK